VRQDYDKYYKTVITTPDQVEGDVKDKVYQIAGISLTKKAILFQIRRVICRSCHSGLRAGIAFESLKAIPDVSGITV
jgi:RNase P subunit RPR2